jgi:3-dehydroquinate synthase
LSAPGPDGRPAVLAGLDEFREHLGGQLTITLLRGIGQAVDVHEMKEPLIGKALAWMQAADATSGRAATSSRAANSDR